MNIRVVAGSIIKIGSVIMKAASLILAVDDLTGNKVSRYLKVDTEINKRSYGDHSYKRYPSAKPYRKSSPPYRDGFHHPR